MVSESFSKKTRRRVLATLSSAGLAAVAGCSSDETDPDESSDPQTEPWDGPELSGAVTFADDPNWRLLGHDTGNTFTNPHAEGPSDDPSVQWTLERTASPIVDWYQHHQPLIVDGTVYATVEEPADDEHNGPRSVVTIDAETGETESLFSTDERIRWRPTIVDDTLYVSVGRTIRAYDLPGGTEQWRSESRSFWTSAIRVVDDVVLATNNTIWGEPDGQYWPQIRALDVETGDERWDGERAYGGTRPLLPVIADGTVLHHGASPLRDLESGESLASVPFEPLYPVLDDGELYAYIDQSDEPGEHDPLLVAYGWASMTERWTYEPDGRVGWGWVVAIDDVIVAHDYSNGVVGIDRETGDQRWQTDPWDDGLRSRFRVATDDTVYAVYGNGAVAALEPTDGSLEWTLRTDAMEGRAIAGCALADDLLVTVGANGTLFGIS
ncbi:outer membrane protein assembly factor BamB family protein [Halopiger goleimassiliensis]|uniref:outer membrane protein assembly factor BamB family protein n=1 Tax=Halopiger goleimassiliensis TaxID=1293048 RepID=UPI000677935E|nr:PQQ-binding-like beta-propeller repeat protein [Halopiger goleimassiliensis]